MSKTSKKSNPNQTKEEGKDFLTAALLSLFLGGIGVDRFYMGYVGLGILKLITFGGCGIWYLIDLILILTGNLKTADKKALANRDKNLKTAVIIVAVVIILGFLANVFAIGSSTTDTSNKQVQEEEQPVEENKSSDEEPKLPAVGDAVRDGKFEMTITKVECGKTVIDDNEFLTEEAQGEFCLMSMNIKNIGDEAQLFDSSNQYVFNADGQKFENDSSAEFAIENNSAAFLEEINPGNQVKATVVFDVSKGTKLVKAELHDSAFSNGVEVSLN
ncbi:MAG: DUF4352 domain-containing protein [bacterium]|nr:DUF4352 domain-containing protein [bacterium]